MPKYLTGKEDLDATSLEILSSGDRAFVNSCFNTCFKSSNPLHFERISRAKDPFSSPNANDIPDALLSHFAAGKNGMNGTQHEAAAQNRKLPIPPANED
mmetsp:Transcript_5134/g.7659  ORF Transcript_5134/g.7659 Transcript_5134/m.7659 type:complete len:99 (+) Transcript_5134:617-913(+)